MSRNWRSTAAGRNSCAMIFAVDSRVRRFSSRNVTDRLGQRQRLFLRDHGDVVAEDLAELHAAGAVGRDDRCARGQRLERDGRAAPRAATAARTASAARVVPRDGVVVHQARERTWPSTPLARAMSFNSAASGPVPQMISRVSGCVRTTSPSASSRKRCPASGCSRLTLTSTCRCRIPSAERALSCAPESWNSNSGATGG